MRKVILVIFTILLLISTYFRLTYMLDRPPARWDEQTNIRVVEETITKNSFPILYYQNKPFFEKPPLWYWINVGAGTVIGITPVSMRLLSILSGLLTILLSAYLAHLWWGPVAGVATWIVLLFSHQLFDSGVGGYFTTHTFNSADLDALQILCMLIAYIALTQLKNPWMVLVGGVATACAVLTKGQLGLLPLIVATACLPLYRKKILQTWMVTLILIIPWYVLMYASFGNTFLSTHIGYHVIDRIFVPLEGHKSSPFFFVGILTDMRVYPVWPIVTVVICWAIFHIKQSRILYLFVLTGAFLLIPTLSDTRLAWYILPVYPFAALLVGAAAKTLLL